MSKPGMKPLLHENVRVKDSKIGKWTEIGPDTEIVESDFGDYSYCAGNNSIFYSTIGKFVSIATSVRINPGNHPVERVIQHHCTYRRIRYGFATTDDESFFNWRRAHRCIIGHDAWIGHGATLMPGVSVGIGAVIGAGAVVTRDIEPFMIAAGVPARNIRPRFSEDIVTQLIDIALWDWPCERMEKAFPLLSDIKEFLRVYG